jgi:hypothetical protein
LSAPFDTKGQFGNPEHSLEKAVRTASPIIVITKGIELLRFVEACGHGALVAWTMVIRGTTEHGVSKGRRIE